MAFDKQLTFSLRCLLKEKYHYPESQILDLLCQPKTISLTAKIEADLKRLESGEPLAYVIGNTSFLNCHIDLSFKPLIPRPETEFLTSLIIDKLKKLESKLFVLDLCCGSGCIGIALLKHLPQVRLDFVDLDPAALKQSQKNLLLNKIGSSRFRLWHSDLFRALPAGKKYDLIISNPPYVDSDSPHAPELDFEPAAALFAPDRGLLLIKQIISQAPAFLKPKAQLYLEIDSRQKAPLTRFLANQPQSKARFLKDQFGKTRFLYLTSPPLSP